MNKEKEYQRLSNEILQDQAFRIRIFTFCITTIAAIIGFSGQIIHSENEVSSILPIIIFAIYSVLIPSIILINHYSRSINVKSEYLKVFHSEEWMNGFTILTEKTIPNSYKKTRGHHWLNRLGGYSTENAFKTAYILLNTLVMLFALYKTDTSQTAFIIIYLLFYVFVFIIMRVFRPIKKKEYRKLWEQQLHV